MRRFFGLVLAAIIAGGAFAYVAAEYTLDENGEKVFAADSGPDKIDVSKYPKRQRKAYKLARKRCSKCHTFARAVGSEFVLKREWRAYVKKMKKKKRSGVRKKDVKPITDFLIYDSRVRKKALWKKKLKAWKAERAKAKALEEKKSPGKTASPEKKD